jgi:heme-degrading monooxygenase HmoA
MHARVSHVSGSPENVDLGIATFKDNILPELTSLAGNRGAILLVDRETGNATAVTFWDNEESMRASEERANQMRSEASQELGGGGDARVERYEVAIFET